MYIAGVNLINTIVGFNIKQTNTNKQAKRERE